MKRSNAYWLWLLADLSLDRAASVLPLLEFPAIEHTVVQGCIDIAGELLRPGSTELKAIADSISAELHRELGDAGTLVESWLRSFCFTDETSRPDLFYWDSHFQDLLSVEPATAPEGIEPQKWKALLAAYHGTKPNSVHLWANAFTKASEVKDTQKTINKRLNVARASPLSQHDLEVYMRFGWNDYGINQGLASLELGTRLSAVKLFWQAIEEQVPAVALENLAYERDMAMWKVAAHPEDFLKDAQRYGITPEQMAEDIFPKPVPPPKLSCLLED